MCLPCIGRWILNHWTTNFFNMRKITEHMYSARNCQAERRSQHWKEKMEELLGQCFLEDHRGRELRWEHGRWNTVTGEKAEKKDAFLRFYTIWVLFHNGRNLHLLLITLQALKDWNLSTNDPITVLSPEASFDISGLQFGSWKMEGFLKFEVRNWV